MVAHLRATAPHAPQAIDAIVRVPHALDRHAPGVSDLLVVPDLIQTDAEPARLAEVAWPDPFSVPFWGRLRSQLERRKWGRTTRVTVGTPVAL
jgi:hypothetical protein